MTVAAEEITKDLGVEDSIWFKLTPLLNSDDPMGVLIRMSQKYGGVIPINLKNQKIFFLSDVDHFRHVLVTKVDSYVKYFDGLRPVFGKSMITMDGKLWQKIRMPQQRAFHPSTFEEYFPFFMEAIKSKMDRFSDLAEKGETVELVEETWTLAADMVCKALFDRQMPVNPHFIFQAVKAYTDVTAHKSIRLKRTSGELEEMGAEETGKAMELWATLPEAVIGADPLTQRENTLLQMLQNAENDPNQPDFDHQQVLDEMKQYLWAGTETTALTLAWAIYLATKYPEVGAAIKQEAEEVYGDRDPTWDDLQNLSYTRSVLQETLRIYPPVWGLIRVADEDDQIGDHQIKKGDKIVMCPYVVHHNPDIWTNPEKFDPTRFQPDRMKKRAKYSYLPFAAGKRACIGGQLSMVENTLALSMLMKRYNPEFVGQEPVRLNATVTLTPKGGLPFKIHEAPGES